MTFRYCAFVCVITFGLFSESLKIGSTTDQLNNVKNSLSKYLLLIGNFSIGLHLLK